VGKGETQRRSPHREGSLRVQKQRGEADLLRYIRVLEQCPATNRRARPSFLTTQRNMAANRSDFRSSPVSKSFQSRRNTMAKKSKLTQAAVQIGSVMGKADRTAHKVAKAGVLAKKELEAISKQVNALKKQLQKTTKRLKSALS
jgi:hypothetical protein